MGRLFVDRRQEMGRLTQAARDDGEERPVFVFIGVGGMGKTALRMAFEAQILKPGQVPYAVLDYDSDPNLCSIEATLRAIRRQLGRKGVRTPVFDYLYARYFELSTGFKLSPSNFPQELENVAMILEGIPFFGNVTQILHGLTKLGLGIKERLQHKEWLYRIQELEPIEVLNLLPEVLAEDLEEAALAKGSRTEGSSRLRISLLFDAYERLRESQIDDTLHRRLLLFTPHLLRVIFTRDPLPWEQRFPKEWRAKITHIPPLEVLSPEDAELFLLEKGLESAELRNHLNRLTGGYPFHLELTTDIAREIEETTGRKPGIQDFQGAEHAMDLTEELVNRLLRQLKNDERDLMGLASYPRWVTEEVLEVLSSTPESVGRIFRKFAQLSMFSRHPEIEGAFVLREEIRRPLISQQRRGRLWKERHRALAQFHRGRFEETHHLHHLREALYHGFYEDPDRAMKLFEDNFWTVLEEFRFGEAESLLEAIPLETLSSEDRRRVDYAHARLLTSSVRSQHSLEMAKELYQGLVTSETDEALLAEYLSSFGTFLSNLGEHEKALEYLERSLSIRLNIYGKAHQDVATSYNSIGFVYWGKGEYSKALEYYEKSLKIRLKIRGEEHPDVANSYNNLGVLYWRRGEYGKALEYFEKSLMIRLRAHGEEHPDVATSYNNICGVYWQQGEYDKALEYIEKSLEIRLKIYGEEHPDVGMAYNNISLVYWNQGEYEKALSYALRSLAVWLKIYGEMHPDVAISYNNIGEFYSERDECEKALEYFNKSLMIRLKVYGEEHPDVARSYNNMGCLFCKSGEYGKALDFHQKSLAIWLRVYGEEHPDIAKAYSDIGDVHSKQGDYQRALCYFEKSLTISLKVHGEGHPNVANCYEEIACTLREMKRYEEAFDSLRRGVEIYSSLHLWKDAVEGLFTLAAWLEEVARHKEAEEARRKARRLCQEHGLSEH